MSIETNDHSVRPIESVEAESLLRCYYLADFLGSCIVDDKYKPPVTLSASIKLSTKGRTLANQAKGEGISLMEGELAAYMTMWAGDELLIDANETEIDSLRSAISSEIKRSKIRFPWIYGRKLYDAVSSSSFHGSAHPSHEDTLRLLDRLPLGVFQIGPYVAGPYGLVESKQWRIIRPRIVVPSYHCDDIECDRVHSVHLSTADSGVSKAIGKLRSKVAKLHKVNVEYREAVLEVQSKHIPPFSWFNNSDLPFFLFECLTIDEIRKLLVRLLDAPGGHLRAECLKLGEVVKDAGTFAGQLSEGQLLQVILLAGDSEVHETLNRMVWSSDIEVARAEIRYARIVAEAPSGLSGRMQISHLGVRHAPSVRLAPVRLRKLISECFPENDQMAEKRLGWLLREYEGESPGAKLTSALNLEEPASLVNKLIVRDEKSYRVALLSLGLPIDVFANASDEEIARLIAWHVGFVSVDNSVELQHLNDRVAALKKLISSIPPAFIDRTDANEIRALSINLFVGLEEILKRALCFIVWAMLRDYRGNSYVLDYSQARAQDYFQSWILEQQGGLKVERFEKWSLGDILEGYGIVAKVLKKLESERVVHLRPESEWPRSARYGANPFVFPFQHKFPFLDLDAQSRNFITEATQRIASSLSESGVLDVRNGYSHHTDEVPDTGKIGVALDAIDGRVAELVASGLYPSVYVMDSSNEDNTGRRRVTLRSASGAKVVLTRPSAIDLFGFPVLNRPQVIVPRAKVAESGEPLRFLFRVDSAYDVDWEDFPKRPVKSNGFVVSEFEDLG
ncbi:hypothetical protein AB0H12_05245 [Actinosynnema sp. NPDC023794]